MFYFPITPTYLSVFCHYFNKWVLDGREARKPHYVYMYRSSRNIPTQSFHQRNELLSVRTGTFLKRETGVGPCAPFFHASISLYWAGHLYDRQLVTVPMMSVLKSTFTLSQFPWRNCPQVPREDTRCILGWGGATRPLKPWPRTKTKIVHALPRLVQAKPPPGDQAKSWVTVYRCVITRSRYESRFGGRIQSLCRRVSASN